MNKKQQNNKDTFHSIFNIYTFLLIIAILFNFFIRLRISDMPLERDEGEFGYIAQMILDGESPFSIYNFKIPGVSYVYALFMLIFGQTVTAIRMSLIFFNIITIIFLYLLSKKLFSPLVASIAALAYSLMSVHYGVLGNAAHATHYMNTGIIAGLFFLIKAIESQKTYHYLLAGLMTGIAFIMKQPTAFFIPMLYIFIIYSFFKTEKIPIKKLATNIILLSAGIAIPFLITVLLALSFNDFENFWLWNFVYPREAYAEARTFEKGLSVFQKMFPEVTRHFVLYWLTGIGGIILALFSKMETDSNKWFIALLAIFSIPPVVAGFYFRNHYFINFLPILCIGIGLTFYLLKNSIFRKKQLHHQGAILMIGIFFLISLPTLSNESDFYFNKKPIELCRDIYGANPFIEAQVVSRYINTQADSDDTIAVMGSEAEVLFYTGLKSATGYIFTYPLVENQPYNKKMQHQFINEVEEAMPEYFVFFNIRTSWMADEQCPKDIFDWRNEFTTEHYGIVGIAEMYNETTIYKWNKEALGYQPKSSYYILVFKRLDLLLNQKNN